VKVARIHELEPIQVAESTLRWIPIRRHFGIRAFGVNAYAAKEAGDHVVEEHTEATNGHEELYFVVSGHARFTVAGEDVDAPTGTLVFIRDPEVERGAAALEAGTTVLALGAKPGEVYRPSAWEEWYMAYALAEAGQRERGLEALRAALAERQDHPVLHYHVACFNSLLGRREEALDHLRRALELGEFLREWARTDEDLDAIRDDARFPA